MVDFEWIKQTIASWYGLEVTIAWKVRDAWRVETPSGPKCFKQVEAPPARVKFTAAAVRYLVNNGFAETVPFLKTVQNSYLIDLPEGVFYLTDWIHGREGDMSNFQDIMSASKVLAKFHRASIGFFPPDDCKPRESWGDLPDDWQKRKQQLEKFIQLARQQNDEFSKLYLDSCAWYIFRCAKALEILRSCDYEGLVTKAKLQGSLCHRDFTYHNFIIDQYSNLYIIDFDYCTQEIRAYDIGRFARKVGKNIHWQLSPVKLILQTYNEESVLTDDELVFILAFLYFPQRFWRLASRYFSGDGPTDKDYCKQLRSEIRDQKLEENFLIQLSLESSRGVLIRR